MKRLAAVVLVACVLGGFGTWAYRRRLAPATPPPTPAEIEALQSERDRLQERLKELVVAAGERSLTRAPRAGLMIGVPTSLTRSIAEQVVTGLFGQTTLRLENLKVHHEGGVKAKMLFRKKQIGRFVLDVNILEVEGVLKPGKPVLRFAARTLSLALPVSLAEGHGRADLRFRWDSKGLAANMVCGDIDVTKQVTGNVVPAQYQLSGVFGISARDGVVVLRPDFGELAVRISVAPTDATWHVVDEVVDEQRAGCEVALGKIDIKEKLAKIVGRGFNVKIPKKLYKPIRLPAGIRQSLEVQGLRFALEVKPTDLLVSEERLWYGADLQLEAGKAGPVAAGGAK